MLNDQEKKREKELLFCRLKIEIISCPLLIIN